MATSPITHFDQNISYTRDLLALGRAVDAATTGALAVGDIQRAAIVMAVSAMDYYVHEKTRSGMNEVLAGLRPLTPAFTRFPVSISLTLEARRNPSVNDWLDEAVRAHHGHRPFLKTDDIADALRLITTVQLWNEVATHLGSLSATVKTQIKAIVDRRNKIAHEADLDPTQPGRRWPIDDALATDAVNYVEKVVQAMDARV